MLTFRQFVNESAVNKAAALGITAKIVKMNSDVQRDRAATRTEKSLSSQIAWLAGLVSLGSFDRK